VKTEKIEMPVPQKTPDHEVKALLNLASRSSGHILEIGTFVGQTAREFATRFPERLVFCVDWSWANMDQNQTEILPPTELGKLAKGLPNVFLYNQNSRTFKFPCNGFTFVFIDGDHSYEGVAADTDMVFSQAKPGTIVAWHDFYNREWSQVERYLREQEQAGRFELTLIEGTCIAYTEIK